MRGVGQRTTFICRDCSARAIGIVLTVTAAGEQGIGHVELPHGWESVGTVGGTSFLCRACAVSTHDDALCGAGG